MKKSKVFIIVFILSLSVFSQDTSDFVKVDSLEVLLKKSNELRFENKMYESLELAFKAVNYSHKLQNNHYLSHSYFSMGVIQYAIIDYENATKHLLKALEYTEKTKEKILLPYILHNLANIYYDGNNDLENALKYYKKAVELGKQNRHISNYQTPLISLVWTYMDLNKFDEAFPYLKEADSIERSVPDSIIANKGSLYLMKARNYVHQGNIESAKEYFNKAYDILEKQKYWLKGKSYFYQYRSQMYKDIKDYPKAIADLEKLQENEEKVFKNAQSKNTEIAKIRFEVDKYELELKTVNREKTLLQNIDKNNKIIIYVSTACIFLLIGIIFFYYRGYRSKKRSTETLKLKNKELNEAKSVAEKLNKVKSQFISTISHELRTPLYGVIGISSILLEKNTHSKSDKELLGSLKFSADYLLNLVNKVLKISKIDADERELINTPTNLLVLSKNIMQSFEYQAKEKQNKLAVECKNTIPYLVNIDTLRISEVLINLIGNAIKFTKKGNVWLRIKPLQIDKNTVCIRYEIEDTGIGIPENQKEYIFEEFSQIGSIYENKQGTGLGLSIVKKILKMMNSKIHFESKKGVGSKFYFDLKLEIAEQLDTIDHETENSNTTKNIDAKILVAEDNKINQMVTKKLLRFIGYDCTIVENGMEAVEILQKEKFSLVLMDINMPILDGMKATLKIRKFDKDTPIIALTASELSEVEDECRNAGMNDLINKPLNKTDLKEAILKNLIKPS